MDILDKKRILELFRKLDDKMHNAGLEANIYVVGGVAIAFTVNEARVTSDIDGFYENFEIDPLANQIADEEGLSRYWLNHSINQTMAYFGKDEEPRTIFNGKNLTIEVASPHYVLAMKLASRREKDIDDIVVIVKELNLNSKSEIIHAVGKYFRADLSAGAYQEVEISEFLDLIIEEGHLEFG